MFYNNKSFLPYGILIALCVFFAIPDCFSAAGEKRKVPVSSSQDNGEASEEDSGISTPPPSESAKSTPQPSPSKPLAEILSRVSLVDPSPSKKGRVDLVENSQQAMPISEGDPATPPSRKSTNAASFQSEEVSGQPVGGIEFSPQREKQSKSAEESAANQKQSLEKKKQDRDKQNKFLMASLLYCNDFFINQKTLHGAENKEGRFFSIVPQDCFAQDLVDRRYECENKKNRILFFKSCCDHSDKLQDSKKFFESCKQFALGYEELILFSNFILDISEKSFQEKPIVSFQEQPIVSFQEQPIVSFQEQPIVSFQEQPIVSLKNQQKNQSSSSSKEPKTNISAGLSFITKCYQLQQLRFPEIKSSGASDSDQASMLTFVEKFDTEILIKQLENQAFSKITKEMLIFCLQKLNFECFKSGGIQDRDSFYSLMSRYLLIPGFIFSDTTRTAIIHESLFKRIFYEGSSLDKTIDLIDCTLSSIKDFFKEHENADALMQRQYNIFEEEITCENLKKFSKGMLSFPLYLLKKDLDLLQKEIASQEKYNLRSSTTKQKVKKDAVLPQKKIANKEKNDSNSPTAKLKVKIKILEEKIKEEEDQIAPKENKKENRSKGPLYELTIAPKLEDFLKENIIFFGQRLGEFNLDYDLCTKNFCIEAKNRNYTSLNKADRAKEEAKAARAKEEAKKAWKEDRESFIYHKNNLEESVDGRSYFVVFGGNPPEEGYAKALAGTGIDWIHLPATQTFEEFEKAFATGKIEMSEGMRARLNGSKGSEAEVAASAGP